MGGRLFNSACITTVVPHVFVQSSCMEATPSIIEDS
jgi:hypothetical protein